MIRPLTAAELLTVWEWGITRLPVERALSLLAAASPESGPEALAMLSIGQRDAALLILREYIFGSQLTGLVSCPECRETVELNFSTADIRVQAAPAGTPESERSLRKAGYRIRYRLPDSRDLQAIAHLPTATAGRQMLLERCLQEITHKGHPKTLAQLPEKVIAAAVNAMAEADPQADIKLSLACPACGQSWKILFDILSYFWSEIHAWAGRMLQEIHLLAGAYGWREGDILALSPARRQLYLQMVNR